MADLHRVNKPACPSCGCCASTVVGRVTVWGAETLRRQCDHCGRVWRVAGERENTGDRRQETGGRTSPQGPSPEPSPDAGVIYRPVRCPLCRSKRCRVASTRGRVRMHKCGACGHPFKSVEED